MKPLFEIFDAEDEKLLASQEIKKNLHKIDAKDASVVVQLSSGDVKGNMFRSLRPGDTELVVSVYSVNEKGNLAVLTGLGKEPVAVISTIFDIVKNCVTKNKTIETVVFRLNKRALKGKEKLLQRIIQKLIKARFGSKFETKEEFIDVSPAMSFIVAQKRNADEIDPEEFIEKQEKVKDKMVVKQLALDFVDSDPTFKLLKKYGTPTEVGENLFSLDVPGLDKTIELVVDLNPRARAKIIAKNVDKKQAMEIYKAGLEQYVILKGMAPNVSDVYSTQFDEYILSTIIHYAKGGKVHFVGNDEEDYDYTRKGGKPSQQYTAKQGAYDTTLKGDSVRKPISDLAKSNYNSNKTIRAIALKEVKKFAKEHEAKGVTKKIRRFGLNQFFNGATLESGTTVAPYKNSGSYSGWSWLYRFGITQEHLSELASRIASALEAKKVSSKIINQSGKFFIETSSCVIIVAPDVEPEIPSNRVRSWLLTAYFYDKTTNSTSLLSKDNESISESKNVFDIAKTILKQNL